MISKMKAQGSTPLEKLLWMGLFIPGPHGRRGVPFCLVGEPGTRKTSLVKQLAQKANLHYEGVMGSIREPTDFLGMPFFKQIPLGPHNQHLSPDGDAEFTMTAYSPSDFAVNCAIEQRAVLMLDEVSTCAPAVQAALLRLLFEGVCGTLELPPNVRMILAMNEVSDAAGGWRIAPALANRIGWLEMEDPTSNLAGYQAYLMGGGGCRVNGKLVQKQSSVVDAKVEEGEVDARWTEAWATAAGVMSGYLAAKTANIHRHPKKGSKDRAWPSMRSNEFATAVLGGGEVYDVGAEVVNKGVAAFIGSGAAGELHQWRRTSDIPRASEFLDGQAQFTHNPARFDRTAALVASCTALVSNGEANATRDLRLNAMWEWLLDLPDSCTDITGGSVVTLAEKRLMIGGPWQSTALKVLAAMEPVMTAAGITPDWKTDGV